MAIAGVVLGIVSDVQDPLARKRVKVRFPWSANDSSDWEIVCVPFGAVGLNSQPKVGETVVVGFQLGDEKNPVVLGKVAGT